MTQCLLWYFVLFMRLLMQLAFQQHGKVFVCLFFYLDCWRAEGLLIIAELFSPQTSPGRVLDKTNISRRIKAKNSTKSCLFSVCNSQITEITTFLGLRFYISTAIIPYFRLSMGRITSLLLHCTADTSLFSLHLNFHGWSCLGPPGLLRWSPQS